MLRHAKKIGEVFNKIHSAHKAYAEAAEGLAELSTEVTPQQYTMLLTAAAMSTIQIVVPGELLSPLTAQLPALSPASMALGRSEIIKYTKLKVLPKSRCHSPCHLNICFSMIHCPALTFQWLSIATCPS